MDHAVDIFFSHCTSGSRTAISPDCVMYRTHGSEGYCSCRASQSTGGAMEQTPGKGELTFGSMIFRYLTWIPLVVKYGISNLTLIGLFALPSPLTPPMLPPKPPVIPPPCSSSPLTLGRPSSARIRNSFPPPNCLIFHTMADFSGA